MHDEKKQKYWKKKKKNHFHLSTVLSVLCDSAWKKEGYELDYRGLDRMRRDGHNWR
jgi:hypothetical protein